jgi:hypothetical protein
MEKLEISRNGRSDQYSVVLSRGTDTIRCMVSVGSGLAFDTHTDEEKRRAALSKAKSLAKALDEAIAAE